MTTRYLPMLAASAPAPFSSDDWLFESKLDGVRAIASVGTTLSLRSRNDVELSDRFPELAELLALAPGTVLDGEIVVMSGGKPDIQSLLPRFLRLRHNLCPLRHRCHRCRKKRWPGHRPRNQP